MLGLGVPLEVPGADEPLAAAVDRAALLLPALTGVVETEQHLRLGPTNLRASLLEPLFERLHSQLPYEPPRR
jgi:hypothetical protein